MTSLEKLWQSASINGDTLMHTKDDWQWRAVKSIRCLRWRFMMTGQSRFTPVRPPRDPKSTLIISLGVFYELVC